ncbi:MAG: hypothetical protein M3021_12335, partial [Actinomycetota bacterium]|nr:hypothetical protein [Actinomycetota bacterium]
MNTSIGDAVSVRAPAVALGAADPAAEALHAAADWRPAARPGGFDRGRAVCFSVANIGAQALYALFNQSMPMYLQSYGLPPALIGLLANERSLVGALVQPFVGRLSDRTRTRLG